MKEFSTKNNFCVFLTQADDLGRVAIPKVNNNEINIFKSETNIFNVIIFLT